jgi:ABC-type amino acid transport substrate-binding protein
LSFLDQQLIDAEEASLGSIILLSYEGGRYRERVRHFKSTSLAVAAMLRGEVGAVLAPQGEVEGLLKGKADIAIAPPPMVGPLANRQWTVGLAVKSAHKALAESIDGAMAEMTRDGELDAIFAKHGLTHNRP